MCTCVWWDVIPGCCNYALQGTALDNVSSYSKEATNTLLRNFYVDDLLKSVPSVTDSLTLIQEVTDLRKWGGFKLTKFISNKKDVLFQIPDALIRRDGVKDKDLIGSLPMERALGIFWDAENDVIKFKIDLKHQPMTRRGMLSIISSIYDPLGLACTFLLQGRRLLQGLCQVMHGWDEMVPDNICQKWEAWKSSLKGLEKNLHKMNQARGLWSNQRSITPSFFRCITRRLWTINIFMTC